MPSNKLLHRFWEIRCGAGLDSSADFLFLHTRDLHEQETELDPLYSIWNEHAGLKSDGRLQLQAFIADFSPLHGIRLLQNLTKGNAKMCIEIRTDLQLAKPPYYREEFDFCSVGDRAFWYEFRFKKPVILQPGQLYYLSVYDLRTETGSVHISFQHATSGRAPLWFATPPNPLQFRIDLSLAYELLGSKDFQALSQRGMLLLDSDKNPLISEHKTGDSAYEIRFCISGIERIISDDITFYPQYGDVIVLPINHPYQTFYSERNGYEIYTLSFDKFHVFENYNPFFQCLCDFLNRFGQGKPGIVSLPDTERNELLSILHHISTLSVRRNNYDELEAFAGIIRLFSILSQSAESTYVVSNTEHFPVVLHDILDYIGESILDIRTASDLCNRFGISQPYLSRIFKQNLGVTPSQYLLGRRISCAKQLLNEGFSVTEACFASGFNDCSYFIQRFKKVTGKTPYKYYSQKSKRNPSDN